jgi:hypothetical protein
MFRGQCGFCQRGGHNVHSCPHPEKQEIIGIMENIIETFNTPSEIKRYIRSLSPVRLDILSCQINSPSGMPTPFLRKSLTEYYVSRMRIRQARHSRAGHEWEDAIEETSSISYSPHLLFRSCVNYTIEFFNYLFHSGRTQYTPVVDTEGTTFRKPWTILPDLSKDEFVEPAECPICFQTTTDKVTLHCSHELCEKCFRHYIENGSVLRAPQCPVCRTCIRNITVYSLDVYNQTIRI